VTGPPAVHSPAFRPGAGSAAEHPSQLDGRPAVPASPKPRRWTTAVTVAVPTLLHVLQVRSGPPLPEPSSSVAVAAAVLGMAQGLPLLWHRNRPLVAAAACLTATAASLLVVPVPPYAAFVAAYAVAPGAAPAGGAPARSAPPCSGSSPSPACAGGSRRTGCPRPCWSPWWRCWRERCRGCGGRSSRRSGAGRLPWSGSGMLRRRRRLRRSGSGWPATCTTWSATG
jgi:hypothetical protein